MQNFYQHLFTEHLRWLLLFRWILPNICDGNFCKNVKNSERNLKSTNTDVWQSLKYAFGPNSWKRCWLLSWYQTLSSHKPFHFKVTIILISKKRCRYMYFWKLLKYFCLESRFNKVAGFQTCNVIKKKIQRRCLSVKLVKFLWIFHTLQYWPIGSLMTHNWV